MRPLPNCSSRSVVLLLEAILVAFLAVAAEAKTPQAIFYQQAANPVWISAKAAEQKGLDDPASFHPMAADTIRHILAQTPVAGCYEAGPIIFEFSGGRNPPRSYQDAARTYPVFAYGVARELTPGFLFGEAGNLVRLEVSQISRGFQEGQEVFVFLPLGELVFQGKKICKRDPRYAGLPAVGDEVLVFSDKPFTVKDLLLRIDYPESVTIVTGDKLLVAPAFEQGTDSRSGSAEKPTTREELLALLPVLQATDA